MNTPLESTMWRRATARWLAWGALVLGLALALPGCGPGTGGTGTGYMQLGGDAADRVAWYLGPWGASNVAVAGVGTASSCATPGTGLCAATNVVLTLDAARIQLEASCWTFRYEGAWTVAANGELRVAGTYTAQAAGGAKADHPATLVAQPQGLDVTLSVQDAAGVVLQGPMVLTRVTDGLPPKPQTCSAG